MWSGPCTAQATVGFKARQLWTPGMEELMALGMLRFGYRFPVMNALLLPSVTPAQMRQLIQYRTAAGAPDNVVKVGHRPPPASVPVSSVRPAMTVNAGPPDSHLLCIAGGAAGCGGPALSP